jgi:hypothetical protein
VRNGWVPDAVTYRQHLHCWALPVWIHGRGIPAAGYHARKGATAYSRFGHMEEAFRQLDIMLEKGLQLTVGLDPWKRHFSSWISC